MQHTKRIVKHLIFLLAFAAVFGLLPAEALAASGDVWTVTFHAAGCDTVKQFSTADGAALDAAVLAEAEACFNERLPESKVCGWSEKANLSTSRNGASKITKGLDLYADLGYSLNALLKLFMHEADNPDNVSYYGDSAGTGGVDVAPGGVGLISGGRKEIIRIERLSSGKYRLWKYEPEFTIQIRFA